MQYKFLVLLVPIFFFGCTNKKDELQRDVQNYLKDYNKTYQTLYTGASEASWKLNTRIVEGDTLTEKIAQEANEKLAAFTGSKENIKKTKKFLESKDLLTDIQIRELDAILYTAGGSPEVAKDIIKKKIKAQTEQTRKLYGFDFKVDGKSITTNEIDEKLKTLTNANERQKVWEASKEVGKILKPGLENLRNLRNQSVQALGYEDFFSYMVSDYGMTTDEMLQLCSKMITDIWPLYRELHTWARYTLAEKYHRSVPEMLPAHWLPNRWGQDWIEIIDVEGINLDNTLKQKSAEWIIHEGENFYVSLGFDSLPQSFYEKSSLYPVPKNADYKKNNHASAWHINLNDDVRSLMSIEPNTEWWQTALHELGHIYYFISYSNPDVPIILRGGANRAYHEAIGSLMGLAALQKPFLESLNLVPENIKTDESQSQSLLQEALDYIVFIPWSAGVMASFEHDLYSNNLPIDQFNKKWWQLKKKYQGIVPPTPRGEEFCDAASKTHINTDPAGYYDYAISNVLLFQFHDFISKKILKENPHATNYYGSKEIGDFLKSVMRPGATVDWREHLKRNVGSELSAKPMVDYFKPLLEYLKKENKGRKYTLPEIFNGFH